MADELEMRVFAEVVDVPLFSREEVVDAHDLMAFAQQAFAKVGAQKAGSARDQDFHGVFLDARFAGVFPESRWLMPIKVRSGSKR